MIVFAASLWINRIVFLLLATMIAGDIFDNTYASDDLDVEPPSIWVLFLLTPIYLLLEIVLQTILRRTRWFIVVGHIFLTILLCFITAGLMDWHYKRLPVCRRDAACARQLGSPYMESQIPEPTPASKATQEIRLSYFKELSGTSI